MSTFHISRYVGVITLHSDKRSRRIGMWKFSLADSRLQFRGYMANAGGLGLCLQRNPFRAESSAGLRLWRPWFTIKK